MGHVNRVDRKGPVVGGPTASAVDFRARYPLHHGKFQISTHGREEFKEGRHRFEHWYRDNTVYFVTARCRDRFAAFASEETKQIFWDGFYHYGNQFGFEPWFASLMDNHYHFGGHLLIGKNLGAMMQRIHGSVAKLVNDILPERRVPFWREEGRQNDYYDGCLRDPLQCRRACRYTLRQAERAGIVKSYTEYPHTRLYVDIEAKIEWAMKKHAFMLGVGYPRYDRRAEVRKQSDRSSGPTGS